MFRKKPEPTDLDLAVARAHKKLLTLEPGTEEYGKMLAHLTTLNAMQPPPVVTRPSADAMVAAAANLGGILAIVNFERLAIATSKAFQFAGKFKH